MTLSSRPIPRPRKTHPIQRISITTAQIQSVVGDRLNERGEVVERNKFCSQHWLRGLHSSSPHRWTIGFNEVVYGDVERKNGEPAYRSDRERALANGVSLWEKLVEAVDMDYREERIAQ